MTNHIFRCVFFAIIPYLGLLSFMGGIKGESLEKQGPFLTEYGEKNFKIPLQFG